MDTSRELSVGELIEHLLADSLIDEGHITGESVTVVQGNERHSFPYEQGRTFLMGMVRGRSWNMTGDAPPAIAARPHAGASRHAGADAAGGRDSDVGGQDPGQHDGLEVLPSPTGDDELDSLLDDLLAMAVEMRIMEKASKDVTGGTVTIGLTSCETTVSRSEAIVFLSECILHGLNVLRWEATRPPLRIPGREVVAHAGGRREPPAHSATGRPETPRRRRTTGDDNPSRGGTSRPIWEPLSRRLAAAGNL